jgi:hypothetical protein
MRVHRLTISCSDLQQRLDMSQAECLDLQRLLARVSR